MGTEYEHIIPGLVDIRQLLPTKEASAANGWNRGPSERIPLADKRGVVIHYRGVVTPPASGWASLKADADYHIGKNWARPGETPVFGSGIMYHIGIDSDGTAYLMRDLDRVLWHCGAWPQNADTLAIQVPLGGSQRATPAQLATLTRIVDQWLVYTGAPRSEVWGHLQLSSTDCPGTLMPDFVTPYRAGSLGGSTPAPHPQPPAPTEIRFGEVDDVIAGGFKAQWEVLEAARHVGTTVGMSWLMLGLPRSPEFDVQLDGARRRAQVFDCGALVWQPDQPRPWDIRAPLSRHWVEVIRQGVAAGVLDLEPLGLALTSAGNVTTRSEAA